MAAGEMTDAAKGFNVPFWIQLRLSNFWVQLSIILIWGLQFCVFIFHFDRVEVAVENGGLAWQVLISIMIVFGFFLGKHLHNGIIHLYGIDPAHPETSKHSASLENLFREGFPAFQKDFKVKLLSRGHNIFALIVAAFFFMLLVPTAAIGLLEGKQSEIWEVEIDLVYFLFAFAGWYLYAFVILEWVSAFSSLLIIALNLGKLSSDPRMNILQVSILKKERKSAKKPPLSLKEFKDECKEISKFLSRFFICILIILTALSIFAFFMFDYAIVKADERVALVMSGLLPIILIFTIFTLLLFSIPQWYLMRLLATERAKLVSYLEGKYEAKKLEWLLLPIEDADPNKQKLGGDLDALSLIISDLKRLRTWSFDIKLDSTVWVVLFVELALTLFTEKILELFGII